MKKDLYVELKCKNCDARRKQVVGTSDNDVITTNDTSSFDTTFRISDVIAKQYTGVCEKCKKFTVWEVIAYLGVDYKPKQKISKRIFAYFKRWNWSAFFVMLLVSGIGALGNEHVPTIGGAFLLALCFGVPLGLIFAWITMDEKQI